MTGGTVEDKDDVFIENLCTVLLLLLGALAVFGSVSLLGYSVILTWYNQQFGASILNTSIFATSLLVVGLGSIQLFRRRRRLRKEKTSSIFYRAR